MRGVSPPPMAVDVARAFNGFPHLIRRRLIAVRRLIFEVAHVTAGVGPLTETLKWGEPAYLTEATRSGSTIRLGRPRSSKDACAILFNCRTTLLETFRERFPGAFSYDGNRALLISAVGPLPKAELASCLVMALTYHRPRLPSIKADPASLVHRDVDRVRYVCIAIWSVAES